MLGLFKRLFGRAHAPAIAPAPVRPKLSRGTPASQPVAVAPTDTPAPAPVFGLFDGPASLRPRQIDHAKVRETAARVLAALDQNEAVLPPSPVMALRVSVFLKKGDVDTNELVRLIGQDPSITAKVLQVANSALYSPAREIDTVRAAVTAMGTKSVSTLVLAEATRSMFDPGARQMPDAYRQLGARLFHDAATASHGAGALAIATGRGRIDRVFLGGMLHDIGKPLALRLLGTIAREGSTLEPDMLDAVLEEVHVAAGRHLMHKWELPEALIAMCERHHDEDLGSGADADDLHVLRVASGMVAHLRGAAPGELHAQVLHSMNALKITPDHTRVLVNDAREHSRVVVATYGLETHLAFVSAQSPTARHSSPGRPVAVAR